MVLVLSVLRCPDQATPEQRRVSGGEYVMGRGAECDWPLRDPDRVLSKRHCAVEFLSGAWQVRDLSTNGTYVNNESEPVGRDQVRVLRDGDRLRLGSYEIECRVEEEAAYGGTGRWQSANAMPDPMAPPAPAASDIFSAPLPGLSPAGGTPMGNAPLLPSDFDPFAPEDHGPVMPDHRPSTNDVFTPPRATMPDLLPTDWDAPIAAPPPKPSTDHFAELPDPFADAPPGAAAGPDTKLPDPFADFGASPAVTPRPAVLPAAALPDPFAAHTPAAPAPQPGASLPDPFAVHTPVVPAPQPTAPLPDPFADAPPAAAAVPSPAQLPDPFADFAPPVMPAAAAPAAALPVSTSHGPFAEPGLPPSINVVVAVAAPTVPSDGLHAALALVFQAAGLAPPAPGTDAAAALTAAGASLRASVAGMRALLIARADVKREFRIEQTMIRASGNNPVKFSATDDTAVLALLSPGANGPAAMRETVADLTAHQLATVAATQAAAKALLSRLSPLPLETEITSGGIMPGGREKRLWEAYRKLHQQVTDQFEDDFDSAFGKAFARAYEEAARGGR
ncbi:MAG: type secretion system-associated domain protein TagH [Rubritepida sp.]|nr:type secretion system-associated domain protein TagH [Rubritepida sp.]